MSCVNTATSLAHCGTCGNACPSPTNGAAACVAGRCEVACDGGFHRCGGACVSDGAVASCGARCEPCPARADATSSCAAGACGFTCNAGFADCDGDESNGCETSLNSPSSCGTCGRACATANARPTCAEGACGFTCNAGFGDCDGNATNGCENPGPCLPCAEGWRPMADGPGVWAASCAWTGQEMLVWGGVEGSTRSGRGWRYNPRTDAWMPMAPAPIGPRTLHHAVWTGSDYLIWGGTGASGDLGDGARYDPRTDRWTMLQMSGAPGARNEGARIWTGRDLVVWGGGAPTARTPTNTGGRYAPATDRWSPTATTNAPSARQVPAGVWTGTEMLVWGGQLFDGSRYVRFNDGARYDPLADRWMAMTGVGAPPGSAHISGVWTGTEALFWGGHGNGAVPLATGGRYAPASDRWAPMSTRGAPPRPRAGRGCLDGGRNDRLWRESPNGRHLPRRRRCLQSLNGHMARAPFLGARQASLQLHGVDRL
jgi:hypothetical protein